MTLASIFNLSATDLLIILSIVLLLYGSKKLPELGRGMAQAIREMSKAEDEFKISGPEIISAILLIASLAFLLAAAAGLINPHR